MDPIELAQAGPVAILLAAISLMVVSFAKGTVVPGWLYQQEREQRIKAEELAEENSRSLTALAKAAVDGANATASRRRG
jgi:hypothetical protein